MALRRPTFFPQRVNMRTPAKAYTNGVEGPSIITAEFGAPATLDDDGILAGPTKTRQAGIVDNAHRCGVAPMHERFMEKAFHHEAVEKGVKLQIADLRVTKVKQAADELDQRPPQFHFVIRCVMLHLRSGLILYLVAAPLYRLAKR